MTPEKRQEMNLVLRQIQIERDQQKLRQFVLATDPILPRPVIWAASIFGLLLYAYAIWRLVRTWAARSQLNLIASLMFLGLIGGLGAGLIFMVAAHK